MNLWDKQAEYTVLATMLNSEKMNEYGIQRLKRQDFFEDDCRCLFDIISELYTSGRIIDATSVGRIIDERKPENDFKRISLSDEETTLGIKTKIDLIKDLSEKRKLKADCMELLELADSKVSHKEFRETLNRILFENISENEIKKEIHLKDAISNAMNNMSKRAEGNKGLQTGIKELDNIVVGLEKGQLITLAARPSMGKSAFVYQILKSISLSYPVMLFSFEMTSTQLAFRHLSDNADVSFYKIRHGYINEEETAKIINEFGESKKYNFYIDDTGRINLSELINKIRLAKKKYDIKIIGIDHMGHISIKGAYNKHHEIDEITKSLKSLAKELNIPIIILSQLNRGLENRENKRPMLADLRESGSIEEDSDIVIMMYRDDYYDTDKKKSEKKGYVEILVKKNRDGMIGDFEMLFVKDHMRFVEIPEHLINKEF